jgi:riboflavin biosynthesis pyrimidine reductase
MVLAGRYVLANLLVGADGSTTVRGRSVGLSSPADRRRFHQLRAGTDYIVIGGNTARTEPYASTPVPLIVLTHGQLPDEISSNTLARAVNASLPEVLELLEGNILIEAGPSLLGIAMSSQLVDEFHLTITQAAPAENQIDISNLISGYEESECEEVDGEKFLIFNPKR